MTKSIIPLALQPLTQYKNWVNWIAVPKENGKITKPPLNPITRNGAMPNNPQTWGTYQQAINAVDEYGFEGIGFMFHPQTIPLVGIDLDNCLDDDGNLSKFAHEVMELMGGYWEVSPSGKGLHALVLGQLPPGRRKHAQLGIEMYQDERYFTITGNQWSGSTDELIECTDKLAQLHTMIFGAGVPVAQAPKPIYKPELSLTDQEIINKAMNAGGGSGAKFKRLWHGDISHYNCDESAGDMALCGMLAYWTDQDATDMDRLFRQSELMRDKWDEPHGALTYGQMTINKAISNSQSYKRKPKALNGHAKAIEREQTTVNISKTGFGAEWDKLAADNPSYEFVVTSERYILAELVKRLLSVAFEGTGEGDIARLYIKSGLGTGKTSTLINTLAKTYNELRLFGHRRELIRNMAQSVGITSQQEIEKLADGDFKGGAKLAMVINSIINLKYALPDNEVANAVVVDEIEQVLGSIVAGTVEAKEATYSELLRQLNNATLSALVDADLSPLTIEYLNRDYHGKTVILLNQYQPYQRRKAYSYEDKGNCLGHLLADIEAGQRVVIAMGGSIEEGNAIIRQCLAVKPDLKWIYVNERTAKALSEFTMGLKDGSFKAYDLVMYSPVWQAGVDLNDREEGHFHKAYAFLSKIHTSKEAWQMIGRLRSDVDIHLYSPTAGNYRKGLTKAMIIKEKETAYRSERKHLKRIAMYTPLNIEMNDDIEMTECINLQIDLLLERNHDLSELRENIMRYGQWLGCKIETVKPTQDGADYRFELKEQREVVKKEYHAKIAETFMTSPMNRYEAAVIEKKIGKIDMDDRLRYEGYKVASLYCPDEPVINPTMVATYHEDKSQAEALLQVLLSEARQAERTLKQTGNFIDMRHYVTAWTHKRAILEMLGVKFVGEFGLDVSGVLFSHTSLWAGPIPAYLKQHREELNGCGLMGATVSDKTLSPTKLDSKTGKMVTNEGLTRYVSHILESLGLKPVGHGRKGRDYRILSEQAERMVNLARQLHGALDISIEVDKEPDAPICNHDYDDMTFIEGGLRCQCGSEWTYYGWLHHDVLRNGLLK